MCGICGVITKNKSIDKMSFSNMVDIVTHRGPDDRGEYYDGNIALGHRRLSIQDLSEAGHQPMEYSDKYVIVFNGEIYNFLELKKKLKHKGYNFYTKTDTEVILAAYDFWDEDCVRYFNGMWAFCIYDKIKKRLFCSRDRFGVKPFYYFDRKYGFAFASEIKQLILWQEEEPALNLQRMKEFLILGYMDFTNETFFDEIMQLEGGCNLIYDIKKRRHSIKRWYDIKRKINKKNMFEDNCKLFREKFINSVRIRLRSDVKVGSCLSGGLDSSAIVCVVNDILRKYENVDAQEVVSSCFENKEYDEQEFIDEVTSQKGIKCIKVFPDVKDLFKDLDKIIWHMDEPFGSTSIFAQWSVFKTAKENKIKVMLDGQGSDEQLAGYMPFYKVLFIELLRKGKILNFIREINYCMKNQDMSFEDMYNSFLKSVFVTLFVPKKVQRLIQNRHFNRPIDENNLPFDMEDIISVSSLSEGYNEKNSQEYIYDSMHKGMVKLLHYEDRNSMAHSVESRVPFLDVSLAEACFRMPITHKINKGETKAVLRYGLKNTLPLRIKNRYSKLGFVTPENVWMSENYDEFRKLFVDSCRNLSGIIDFNKAVEWFDLNKGNIKKGDFIAWRIICAGRWMKVFNVKCNI